MAEVSLKLPPSKSAAAADDDDSHTRQREQEQEQHIVIVGAGLAGLTAARTLLQGQTQQQSTSSPPYKITIVEATGRVGGRILATNDFAKGAAVDLGAEYLHCTGTILTEWILQDFQNTLSPADKWEHIFVTAHADGGPDEEPTKDHGKYGMYFMDGKLHMYDDAAVKPVEEALHEVLEKDYDDIEPTTSVSDALQPYDLSPSLYRLAVAGFGNTAGCTDMSKLSLRMLQYFEHHWETNEVEGDFRLPEGMYGVVQAILGDLRTYDNFELLLDWPVDTCIEDSDNDNTKVVITNQNDKTKKITANAAIVTVPPPHLPKMLPGLSREQQTALNYIGFDNVLKVMLKFHERPWPEKLQSVVSADGPIPEMWFRDFGASDGGDHHHHQQQHVMVCYFMSDVAEAFLKQIAIDENDVDDKNTTTRLGKATDICLQQLSAMLQLPIEPLRLIHDTTIMHDWKNDEPFIGGGYMYPKTGLEPHHLQALASPVGKTSSSLSSSFNTKTSSGRVFLAGEATNTNACCTLQAAMETGVRAARQVMQELLS